MPSRFRSVESRLPACLLVAVLALVFAPSGAGQQPVPPRQMFDGSMLPDAEVITFSHGDKQFPVNPVARGGAVRPLERSSRTLPKIQYESRGAVLDLYDYMANGRVAELLILKDGKVVMEDYELGTGPQTRWTSFSMAKSVSSILVGTALRQGWIKSIDDPVIKYVPALKGGSYDDVSVRNLLQMASGVRWNETYTDPASDRRKLLELQLQNQPGTIIGYMKALPRVAPPGTLWNYSTGESFLVGALLEGATHQPLATYLSRTLWSRLGMDQDATWWLESPGGMGLAGAGLEATLRDYGRLGQFVLDQGVIDGKSTVPEGWFTESGRPHEIGEKLVDYGYLWWPVPKGDPIHAGAFQAIGIFGQRMYINPREHLVIVVLSARSKPDVARSAVQDTDFFGAVAQALR